MVKLMVVNAARERAPPYRLRIRCRRGARTAGTVHVIQGGYLNEFIVNPLDTTKIRPSVLAASRKTRFSTCGKYRRRRSASCWFAHRSAQRSSADTPTHTSASSARSLAQAIGRGHGPTFTSTNPANSVPRIRTGCMEPNTIPLTATSGTNSLRLNQTPFDSTNC
ncbi:hypothetical protein [Klebsiella phage vB_KshKPC-M]|nr:hypothetical protein [Klebsiella phage vB_KshKPC-M]